MSAKFDKRTADPVRLTTTELQSEIERLTKLLEDGGAGMEDAERLIDLRIAYRKLPKEKTEHYFRS